MTRPVQEINKKEKTRTLFDFGEKENSSDFKMTKNLNVEIDDKVSKRMSEIFYWIVSLVLATISGGIISTLWIMNGDLKELKGKFASPDAIITHLSNRVQYLDSINYRLNNELTNERIEKLNMEISKLRNEHKK